jgi:hypothetical protein
VIGDDQTPKKELFGIGQRKWRSKEKQVRPSVCIMIQSKLLSIADRRDCC